MILDTAGNEALFYGATSLLTVSYDFTTSADVAPPAVHSHGPTADDVSRYSVLYVDFRDPSGASDDAVFLLPGAEAKIKLLPAVAKTPWSDTTTPPETPVTAVTF